MKLIQRLRNIWKLGEIDVDTTYGKLTLETLAETYNKTLTPPKMAQIIKRSSPSENFLKENNNESR